MITILPNSEGNTLIIEASGKLTSEDYEEFFLPKLDALIKEHGRIRVVFYLGPTFKGWEVGAAWDDAKFGLKHKNDFERIALVGGPSWMFWLTKLGSYFVKGEVGIYKESQLDEAIDWTQR